FFDYKKIILLGPSHNFSFSGIVSSPFSKWLTPLRETECLTLKDFPFLEENKFIQESSEIHELEHSLEVELPFLQTIFKDFVIFPLIAGDLEAEEGKKILASILDEESLLVVSSDLSHYLPFNEALKQDKVTLDAILDLDLERFLDYGEACGKIPISFLISLAKEKNWLPKLLKAANSGETQGGKDQVVGYASVVFI
ncbi:MAG TPA: AmmeMemoRadiSam system protein B, partial [Candidatus Paceibacterota bacterium]|nr:AmmeMemoRadiSam system protein B [Candidatus Paceibacterota bacterium]